MLRESDREDQLAELRLQKRNATARLKEASATAPPAASVPAATNAAVTQTSSVAANNPAPAPQPTDVANSASANAGVAKVECSARRPLSAKKPEHTPLLKVAGIRSAPRRGSKGRSDLPQ